MYQFKATVTRPAPVDGLGRSLGGSPTTVFSGYVEFQDGAVTDVDAAGLRTRIGDGTLYLPDPLSIAEWLVGDTVTLRRPDGRTLTGTITRLMPLDDSAVLSIHGAGSEGVS